MIAHLKYVYALLRWTRKLVNFPLVSLQRLQRKTLENEHSFCLLQIAKVTKAGGVPARSLLKVKSSHPTPSPLQWHQLRIPMGQP